MSSLFAEIARLLERTYASTGIALEDCLIGKDRCRHLSALAGAQARELSELARTFLRHSGDNLFIGIYYSRWLIEQLERSPYVSVDLVLDFHCRLFDGLSDEAGRLKAR